MKRGRSTGKPTKDQEARFQAIKEMGCIACRLNGAGQIGAFPEIHHLTIGGKHGQKRRGHDFTIGLCGWHHRGCGNFLYPSVMKATYGPSYALSPRGFRETFGNDDFLLGYQNELLGIVNA